MPNIGTWNLIEVGKFSFSQKEALHGNYRDFYSFIATYPCVFIHFEITRHDEIMNKPILERKMITQVGSINSFSYWSLNGALTPQKEQKISKNCQKLSKIVKNWNLKRPKLHWRIDMKKNLSESTWVIIFLS